MASVRVFLSLYVSYRNFSVFYCLCKLVFPLYGLVLNKRYLNNVCLGLIDGLNRRKQSINLLC